MSDMTCLAEGMVVPADFEVTGLNLNEIIVGPTGCGKSMSNAYSRLIHTSESSVVVPIAKKAIKERFISMFKKRGYRIIDLNFAHPEAGTMGYDPLDFVNTDDEVINLARNQIGAGESRGRAGESDPYWNDSATSVLAALIALVRITAKDQKKKASYADVIDLFRSMKVQINSKMISTNLDPLFEKAERKHPGNQASELWKTVQGLAAVTSSCIFSIVNNSIDKTFSENIIKMLRIKERVSFRELGETKTACFITTSPMNKTYQNYVNVMYSDMFRVLFEMAEESEDYRLKVPVHVICDDFACGSRIKDFEDYISIFRATGISVTMLLQSETQLVSMYGEPAANTIINNCDTYVYMGGMDIETCRNISHRMNKPLNKVMAFPLEQVVVFRRGSEPYVSRRYQTLQDPLYISEMSENTGDTPNTDSEDRV